MREKGVRKVPEVGTTHQGATGGPGVPRHLVPPSGAFLAVSYFPNFCYILKLTENIFADFSESVYLPYHVPPLFQLFWSVPEGFLYVFLRCHGLHNIAFNINRRTWDIVFKSLTIDHLWIGTFGIIYFDSSRAINLFYNIRSFPFGEKFSCKESEMRVVQENIFSYFEFPLLDSFIMPSFNLFFKEFGIFIGLGSPFI